MDREKLKQLAATMTAEQWPAVKAQYRAEQAHKTMAQRVGELEESALMLSIGLLRFEPLIAKLAANQVKMCDSMEKAYQELSKALEEDGKL